MSNLSAEDVAEILRGLREPYACMAISHEGEPEGETFARVVSGLDTAIKLVDAVMWQPIESAPKDGTYLFLWNPHPNTPEYGRINTGSFRLDANAAEGDAPLWLKDDYDDFSCGYASTPLRPTHWMPLPKPPSLVPDGGEG